jgi:hypothetical protein
MRRTIWGLIAGGNRYPLLIANNVRTLPTTAGCLPLLSFPLSFPLVQSLNALIVSPIGLFLGLFVVFSLPNSPYKC